MSAPVRTPRVSEDVRNEAKRRVARAFDRAIRACGYANAVVGDLLGVDEARVRRLRSDDPKDLDVVPNLADALLADHALGEHLLRELGAARHALHGPSPVVTLEQELSATMQLALTFSAHGLGALHDGAVDGPEKPGLGNDAAALAAGAIALCARLRGGT